MSNNIWNLAGKNALITGSTYGIGWAIAEEMAKLGANIFIVSRTVEKVKQCAETLAGMGAEADGIVADVTKSEDRKNLFNQISEKKGKLDIVVNKKPCC